MDKKIRGSADLPLNENGEKQAKHLAKRLAVKGVRWDELHTSPSQRTLNTALEFFRRNADVKQFHRVEDSFGPWRLGHFEGRPVKEAVPAIQEMIEHRPWEVPPGMGKDSTAPGESFNAFKQRVFDYFGPIVERYTRNPRLKIAVFLHFHHVRLFEARLIKSDDRDSLLHSIDIDTPTYNSTKETSGTGEVTRLYLDGKRWKMETVNLDSDASLGGGIYLCRHGETDSN